MPAAASLLVLTEAACSRGHAASSPPPDPYYSGPVSDHFDGFRFRNPDGESGSGGSQNNGFLNFFRIALGINHDRPTPWPASVPVTRSVPPRRVDGDTMLVTWIGHASTLVQTQGLNILIDPVWQLRSSPVGFAGPRRVRAPGVRLSQLPPIDLILISHDHYDHFDLETLKYLSRRDRPLIVTGLGNERLLADKGVPAVARDWGGSVPVKPGISVVVTRAHHWSARWLDDKDQTLWCGFRVTLPGGDLYYSGDTGPGDMRWAVEARGGAPVRFAILPIAPYKVDTPVTGNHIDPSQAVSAFQQLDAAYALGVHWGTFELGPEPIDGAPKLLAQSLADRASDAGRFRTLEAGGQWTIPALASTPTEGPP